MKITEETMQYIGILAKLELDGEERRQAAADMEKLLKYVSMLDELDTEGVEPLSHVFPVNNVFREDVVTNGDQRDDIIKNAPADKEGMFKVPKTVE